MAFVNINNKIRLVLTKYGKEKLIKGELSFKYFSFSDDDVRYELNDEPTNVVETQGSSETNFYNANKSSIIYKK